MYAELFIEMHLKNTGKSQVKKFTPIVLLLIIRYVQNGNTTG